MTSEENVNLQRWMNFRLKPTYSVILMSVREWAPYYDQVIDEGTVIIYEWHDVNNSKDNNPKLEDQPYRHKWWTLTQNWKFFEAAEQYKENKSHPELIKVYEKIKDGIWSFAWYFLLKDAWQELVDNRSVFKFKLEITDYSASIKDENQYSIDHNRIIPTAVKVEVRKRDGWKCIECGSSENLHFDHILPYSKWWTSLHASNIQLLCMKHNLYKSNKIV